MDLLTTPHTSQWWTAPSPALEDHTHDALLPEWLGSEHSREWRGPLHQASWAEQGGWPPGPALWQHRRHCINTPEGPGPQADRLHQHGENRCLFRGYPGRSWRGGSWGRLPASTCLPSRSQTTGRAVRQRPTCVHGRGQ